MANAEAWGAAAQAEQKGLELMQAQGEAGAWLLAWPMKEARGCDLGLSSRRQPWSSGPNDGGLVCQICLRHMLAVPTKIATQADCPSPLKRVCSLSCAQHSSALMRCCRPGKDASSPRRIVHKICSSHAPPLRLF